ncbi:MAG: hypothetical protein J0L64_21045 [Acidobacteria bacterium]|nr:hypothetical protein [Acidobacteriota bacterium]
MIGNLFGPSGAGDILKTVFKATPMGAASSAISDIFKSTGIMDDIGKLLDGAVSKPKPGGFGGIDKMMKKIIGQMEKEKGLPYGLMPRDYFDGPGGGMSGGMSGGIGKATKSITAGMAAALQGMGGKTGPAAAGGAMGGMGGGMGGKFGPPGGMAGGKAGAAAAGGAMAGMGGGLAGMAQKAIFISALQQAIQKAASQQNFNMETAINDLWIKLSSLRPQGRQDLQELNQMFQMLEGIARQMQEMQKNAIQNMR